MEDTALKDSGITLHPREKPEVEIDHAFFQYSPAKLIATNQRLIFLPRASFGAATPVSIPLPEITHMRIGPSRITMRYSGKQVIFSVQEERSGTYYTSPEATLELFEWLETILPDAEISEDQLTRKGFWLSVGMLAVLGAFIAAKIWGSLALAAHYITKSIY